MKKLIIVEGNDSIKKIKYFRINYVGKEKLILDADYTEIVFYLEKILKESIINKNEEIVLLNSFVSFFAYKYNKNISMNKLNYLFDLIEKIKREYDILVILFLNNNKNEFTNFVNVCDYLKLNYVIKEDN